MKKQKTLFQMNRQISEKLLEAIYLLDILRDIAEGEAKQDTLILKIKQNIKSSFDQILLCRKILSNINMTLSKSPKI